MANGKKEPIIGKSDRPGAVNLDASLADLKLRDLVGALSLHFPEIAKPEHFKPEHFKPEVTKPEVTKPEAFKPELFKEFSKPEHFKPEFVKPEIFKEFSKPEDKPDPIDSIVNQIVSVLTAEQARNVATRLTARLASGAPAAKSK